VFSTAISWKRTKKSGGVRARQKSGRALACVIAAFFWLDFSFGTFLLGNAKEKYIRSDLSNLM